jgi:hypothetical protein
MTKQEQEQHKLTEQLICSIAKTFRRAYLMRLLGVPEEHMLIDYDIQAAVSTTDSAIIDAGRSTIKAAVRAVEERIPFLSARAHLIQLVSMRADHVISDVNKKRKRTSRAIRKN